ncbi:uncharacterized protein LOC120085350 isoform X2 [Benincasa hispida]|uniref:uncharacterized protein LOC120085350 isoform X2 n=1 Tax=Benincasa hispida TaxID=102211 RepID=UPI001902AA9E|nr:uncharacterized protein LOC120085350 isoform X2 [Benincasa hispida]
MAKSSNSKSKPHFFLSCFGFSGKLRRFKPLKSSAGQRKRPFSWMSFHSKPPPPVHSSLPVQINRSIPDSDRLSSISIAPTATSKSSNEDFAVAVSVVTNRTGDELIIGQQEKKSSKKVVNNQTRERNPPIKVNQGSH